VGGLDCSGVLRSAIASDPGAVVDVLTSAVRGFGAVDVVAYLVDFEQATLEPLPDRATHADVPDAEAVVGTLAGRAFLSQQAVMVPRGDGVRVWVPILEGSDRTGVLAMTVPSSHEEVVASCLDAGLLAGYLIAVHSRSTDLYQLYRRRKSMSLAASMQWDLLPPLVLTAPSCQVAARLEPAYDVGGDCFDYALNGTTLDVALVDAMGHGVSSSSIASLALGCYRHGRREGRPLSDISDTMNTVLAARHLGEAFATGQLGRLDTVTGILRWVNAGHPRPLLVRDGRTVGQLEAEIGLPWGLEIDSPAVAHEQLEPGDGVVFFTDGVVEARTPHGESFGIDRLADLVGRHVGGGQPPEQVVRSVVTDVLDHRADALHDDATIVYIRWSPGVP
jgi:serine phosphatase RsbU (regulator of sigma subunit)